jgi:hypothetical protein
MSEEAPRSGPALAAPLERFTIYSVAAEVMTAADLTELAD